METRKGRVPHAQRTVGAQERHNTAVLVWSDHAIVPLGITLLDLQRSPFLVRAPNTLRVLSVNTCLDPHQPHQALASIVIRFIAHTVVEENATVKAIKTRTQLAILALHLAQV